MLLLLYLNKDYYLKNVAQWYSVHYLSIFYGFSEDGVGRGMAEDIHEQEIFIAAAI